MEMLERAMSMEGSFKQYRHMLAGADPPCIPYLGVYLTDLVFVEEGNPRFVGPNSLINYLRHLLVYNVISNVQVGA